ncbi:hypothetical protein GGS20DRAFT_555127 [Poronia punctata]|nr:hypothetical protein GGS20DRAFT_555127 [Poronia punctata]
MNPHPLIPWFVVGLVQASILKATDVCVHTYVWAVEYIGWLVGSLFGHQVKKCSRAKQNTPGPEKGEKKREGKPKNRKRLYPARLALVRT